MKRKKVYKRNGQSKSAEYPMEMTAEELKSTEAELWERQPEESAIAFKYFREYLETPKRRIYDGELAKKLKIGQYKLNYYARTHKWTERARAWDNYLVRKKNEATIRAVEEMAERHAKHAMAVETALMFPIMEFVNAIRSIDRNDIKLMKAKELYKFVIDASEKLPKIIDIERKSRGVPNDISKTDIDLTSDGEPIKPMINISVKGSHSPLLAAGEVSPKQEDSE
jgi:phage antirepressor YoqD-like protein